MEFLSQNMQVAVAALGVLALLLIFMLTWRAVSPRMSGRRGQRLGISEYHEIDKSRRLVLVRRDNVEHLVLIGGAQDLVIEPGITPATIAAAYPSAPVTPEPGNFRPAPRAPGFTERRPAAARPADPLQPPPRREEPEF
jgi:flagellar protein FliO/FliZ